MAILCASLQSLNWQPLTGLWPLLFDHFFFDSGADEPRHRFIQIMERGGALCGISKADGCQHQFIEMAAVGEMYFFKKRADGPVRHLTQSGFEFAL